MKKTSQNSSEKRQSKRVEIRKRHNQMIFRKQQQQIKLVLDNLDSSQRERILNEFRIQIAQKSINQVLQKLNVLLSNQDFLKMVIANSNLLSNIIQLLVQCERQNLQILIQSLKILINLLSKTLLPTDNSLLVEYLMRIHLEKQCELIQIYTVQAIVYIVFVQQQYIQQLMSNNAFLKSVCTMLKHTVSENHIKCIYKLIEKVINSRYVENYLQFEDFSEPIAHNLFRKDLEIVNFSLLLMKDLMSLNWMNNINMLIKQKNIVNHLLELCTYFKSFIYKSDVIFIIVKHIQTHSLNEGEQTYNRFLLEALLMLLGLQPSDIQTVDILRNIFALLANQTRQLYQWFVQTKNYQIILQLFQTQNPYVQEEAAFILKILICQQMMPKEFTQTIAQKIHQVLNTQQHSIITSGLFANL